MKILFPRGFDEIYKNYDAKNPGNLRFNHYNSGGKSKDVPQVFQTMGADGFNYELGSSDPKSFKKLKGNEFSHLSAAKKKSIWKNVQKLRKAAKEGKIDRVVLNFKGHGGRPTPFNNKKTNTFSLWGETYSADNFEAILNQIPSDIQVVFNIDTCYAGGHLEHVFDTLVKRGDCGFATSPPYRKTWTGYGENYAKYVKSNPDASFGDAHFYATAKSNNGRGYTTSEIFLNKYFERNSKKIKIKDAGQCNTLNMNDKDLDGFINDSLKFRVQSDINNNIAIINKKGPPYINGSMTTLAQLENAYKSTVIAQEAKILNDYEQATAEINNATTDEDQLMVENMHKLLTKRSDDIQYFYNSEYLPRKKQLEELNIKKKKDKRGLSAFDRKKRKDLKRYLTGNWRFSRRLSKSARKKKEDQQDKLFSIFDLESKAAKMSQNNSSKKLDNIYYRYRKKFDKHIKKTANLEDAYRAAKSNIALEYITKHDPKALEQYSKVLACEESRVLR